MRTLIDENTVPPGGWRFFEKETQTMIVANSRDELKQNVILHRQANNLPVGLRLWEEIQEYLCAGLDENHCADSARPRHAQGKRMQLSQIVAGTLTLGHWLATGRKLVTQEEANRRASICAGCNYNQTFEGCQGCNSNRIQGIVETIVGHKMTNHHDQLNACQLCGCALKVKSWVPLDIIRQHTPKDIQEAFPPHCWMYQEPTSK